MSITLKAFAKVNVGLDITGKTDNGYHLLKSVMQTIDLFDEVTVERVEANGIFLSVSNKALACDESNIAYKAARLIMEEYRIEKGVKIHLEKNIPMAAGMAGGSTDAAAVLVGMNKEFNLGISDDELKKMGKKLGADVPFCIQGGCALAEGIGEILTPIMSRPEMYFLIVKPPIDVSTAHVYKNFVLAEAVHPDIDRIIEGYEKEDSDLICDNLGNVLEQVTTAEHPVICDIKKKIVENGAKASLMSGSGPTVFGIFDNKDKAFMAETTLKEEYSEMFVKAVGVASY